jgi:hypothetical protein
MSDQAPRNEVAGSVEGAGGPGRRQQAILCHSYRTVTSTRVRLTALALLLVLAAPGCTKKAPNTTVPAGFVAVRDAEAGFALGVPSDWVQIPLPQDLDRFDKNAIGITNQHPRLGPAIVQARQLLQFGGKLMAVSDDGNSVVNVTIDKTKEKTLAEVAKNTVSNLENNGATDVVQEQASLPAGRALKLTFRYPIEGQNHETVIANEIQYYVLHKGKSIVLTIINGQGDLPATVAGTLRLR